MKNILIVEDEEYAMADLKDSLLNLMPELEISHSKNASEAFEAITQYRFDAIFLDIHLPGMSGIELLRRLEPPVPPVVLVTAHSLHALDAFGLGVVECLLKPIDDQRLRRALKRMVDAERLAAAPIAPPEPAPQEPSDSARYFEPDSHVLLRDDEMLFFAKIEEITRLESQDDGTRVFFEGGSGLIRRPLGEIEPRLHPKMFFRINETDIINKNRLDRISTGPSGNLIAHFPGGRDLYFGTEQTRDFEKEHAI